MGRTQTSQTYSKGNIPKFWPKLTTRWFSVADFRWQIAAECWEIVQWSHNGEPIRNHHRHSFESTTPYNLPSPKWGPRCILRGISNFEWPYLSNRWSDPLHVRFYGRVFGKVAMGCSLGLERLGLETVSRRSRGVCWTSRSRLDTVTPMSRSRLRLETLNVSVSSRSRHYTSHLHRTSKFKLRSITKKSLFSSEILRLKKYLCRW